VSIGGNVKPVGGLQIGAYGPRAGGILTIAARRVNWNPRKAEDELDVARRFCSLTRNGLTEFDQPEENSPTDVDAKSADGKRHDRLQITVLYDETFWQKLKTTKTADAQLTSQDIVNLIEKAVKRKLNYAPSVRRDTMLLIDLNPAGILAQFVDDAKATLTQLFSAAAFKEIWLVGSTEQQVFKLWP
jgi:hypothetical protein